MAEDKDESQEKSQEPSSRRLEKAREDGKVVSSQEMYVFVLMSAGVALMYSTPFFISDFLKIIQSFFRFGNEVHAGYSAIGFIGKAISLVVKIVIIFGFPLAFFCILTQFLVGGINFSLKSIYWKMEKMNPIKGLKRIFSLKGLVNLLKALLKVFILGTITFYVIKYNVSDLTYLTTSNVGSALGRVVSFFPELIAFLLLGLALIAVIDVAWQKYDYIKSLKMSHQDIKDEYKETDGQPEVKQKIRKLQMQAASRATKENASVDNLSEATALITNPTHFAVALKYNVGESSAPIVVAKGRGKVAEKIIKKSKEIGLGKLESPTLARALYFTSEINNEIISKLYNAVAIALAYIYKINNGENLEEPVIELPNDLIFDEFGNKYDK
ncbi:MAG: flagellar biosynthesis protein FlhB [Rickettsiales bacterium]|nr:flagellar biosynthesis protein FlhB [Rickettsiales bacterium]